MDTEAIYDQEFEDLCRKRGKLIDLKYLRGLTEAEMAELATIEARLDEKEKPFYDAVIKNISDMLGLGDAPLPP